MPASVEAPAPNRKMTLFSIQSLLKKLYYLDLTFTQTPITHHNLPDCRTHQHYLLAPLDGPKVLPFVLPAHQLPDPLGGLRPHKLHLLQLLLGGREDPLNGPEVAEEVFCHGVSNAGNRRDEVLLLLFEGPVGLLAVSLGGTASRLLLPPRDRQRSLRRSPPRRRWG